ncbi:MAG: hypothetical protein ACI8P0_002914 [Planctomycetaceae bacterium]|jgi:hypothetical protein
MQTGIIRAASLRIAIVLATLGGVFVLHPLGTAQESDKVPDSLPGQNLTALLETRGSLTLRDATLTEALFALREQWKIDMVVADNVEGNVNYSPIRFPTRNQQRTRDFRKRHPSPLRKRFPLTLRPPNSTSASFGLNK